MKTLKTNKDYREFYNKNFETTKTLFDRLTIGHTINVNFDYKNKILIEIQGNINEDKLLVFCFNDLSEVYVDISIEEIPFLIIEDRSSKKYSEYLLDDTKGQESYVEWLEAALEMSEILQYMN